MASIHYGGALLGTLVILLALFYRSNQDKQLRTILTALLKVEKKHPITTRPRVAVGFGGCVDIFTDGLAVFDAMKIQAPEKATHYSVVRSMENMREAFSYFFVHGAAGERYVDDAKLFNELVTVAESLPNVRYHPGGYAIVTAHRFAQFGCDVLLAAELEQKTITGLDKNIRLTGNPVQRDDIHLILEFKTGERWGKFVSKRSNRFIVNHDLHTPYLKPIEQLQQEIGNFAPNLITIGGLQMLDTFPFEMGEKEAKVRQLQRFLKDTPGTVLKHLELGSYTDDSYFKQIIELLIPESDSLGMNEQELNNFHSILKFGNSSFVGNSLPRVATMLDLIRDVFHIIDSRFSNNKLSRLHMHTLAFQVIFARKNSPWKNNMAAAAKAALMAHRHVCGSSTIDPQKSVLFMDDSFSVSSHPGSKRIPLEPDKPVACWYEGEFHICVAPGLVCTEIYQTAGGGDNISAAALVLQL